MMMVIPDIETLHSAIYIYIWMGIGPFRLMSQGDISADTLVSRRKAGKKKNKGSILPTSMFQLFSLYCNPKPLKLKS